MTAAESSPRTRKSPRRRRYVVGGALAVVALVVAGLGAFAYSKLSTAQDNLNLATTDATELRAALTAGDQGKARTELAQLQSHVRLAESNLDSSILSVAAKTPFVGKNIEAARTISSAVSAVAEDGLPPLVEVADKFNAKTFNPQGGRIDVSAMSTLTPNLEAATKAILKADQDIQSVDASSLLGPLQDPVLDAQDKIGDAASIASRAAAASRIVPRMLTGKHTYLLLFQNNAEIRATGGLPGAYAGLQVDNGKVKLVDQGTGASLGNLPDEVAPLTKEERNLFSTKLVKDFRDVNFTPDFPRAAELAAAIVTAEKGTTFDGVISLDPVTLSYLLKGIGPVTLEDGTRLTADNAIEVLLNGVYVTYPDAGEQDGFFASATQKIFDRVLSGAGDPTALLTALTRATKERRVSVWTKSKAVTREIAGTPLAGELPTGKAASPALGFYLNDATGAKMQYYLDYSLTGKATSCTDAGAQTYTSEMRLHSSAPADSASLPESIQGPGFGALPGTMLMNLYLYGPDAGKINTVEIDNEETSFTRGTHEGRPVVILTVQVDPGKTVTVQSTITSGKGQSAATPVYATPSIVPGTSVQTWKSSC